MQNGPRGGPTCWWITERTVRAIDRCRGEPFFLWCSYPDPHQPFGPPEPWHSRSHAHDMPAAEAWHDDRDWCDPEAAQLAGERGMYDGVPRLPGKSLVPLLTGHSGSVQDAVLIENDEDYRGVSLRTLVTDGAIYTRYRGNRHGELFDLTADPVQRYNRWADPGAAALRGEMEGRLLDKIVDTQARHVRQVAVA